ncbi:MAG: zinc ABC transporter substrate-binding protein [Verrucomicrobia bacterium]|nr:zinc ABC transporter substrate-binding protein [Verrucomicrobiota bacterium]
MKTAIFFLIFTCKLLALDVLVSIPPLQYFVEEIGGELVEVVCILPPGASPHTFEPSPKQMRGATKAKIWFGIGEPFERQLASALPKLKRINVLEGFTLLGGCPHCNHGGGDPHIWMSARLAKVFSRTIAQGLMEQLPEHKIMIESNLERLEAKLDQLDQELMEQLASCRGAALLVAHPAFGYFCRDYDLHQISIEHQGKEPTPKQLIEILKEARKRQAHLVILDGLHGNKGALLVAKELHLPTCLVNPMEKNVPENLRHLANCICGTQHE